MLDGENGNGEPADKRGDGGEGPTLRRAAQWLRFAPSAVLAAAPGGTITMLDNLGIWADLLFPFTGAVVGAVLGFGVRAFVVARLVGVAKRTASRVDDVIVTGVRGPVVVWCTLIGLQGGLSLGAVDPRAAVWLQRALLLITILSVAWTLGSVAAALIRVPQHAASALPSARILSTAVRACVLALGALVALQTAGVSVAPILTALGVGGLAVGLALQDTLANLFAGFHILLSRQVRPGDFVQLSTGEQGFVEDINWRNTTIRQLPNNLVIVPNAQMAKAVMVNFSLPDAEQAVLVQVGVSYASDLDRVERVTVEVATEVQQAVPGAVGSFTPFIRFHTFGDSSISFTTILRAAAFTDTYLITHEFVKRLSSRYASEGIIIPFPQRDVHVVVPERAVAALALSGDQNA